MKKILSVLAVAGLASSALAAPALTLNEGASPAVFANGAGSGFGGALGNGGISMDVVGTDLVISFSAGGGLGDNIVGIFLDTRSGGFTDADMNDNADGGRRVISNLTRDINDNFPAGMGAPDFGLGIGGFGSVLFQLNAGSSDGHLGFEIFNGASNITIPLALLGNPSQIDWFAALVSDSGYSSNESMPASPSLQANGNPGFGNGEFGGQTPASGEVDYTGFNRFVIPTPGAAALVGLGALVAGRRRRA
jgi:hypothetical protein